MNRRERALIAASTMEILESGRYHVELDKKFAIVSIKSRILDCVENTRIFRHGELEKLVSDRKSVSKYQTIIKVENCTTLESGMQFRDMNPMILNFASAKKPGGGFLSGAAAQEESLARSSGLYASLRMHPEFYEENIDSRSSIYLDTTIYSPGVPIFRLDNGELLQEPWCAGMITAPAVNAGSVIHREPEREDEILSTMERRIRYVLALSEHFGHEILILGAWGCGVFRNDPSMIADIFAEQLLNEFSGVFRQVVFAVFDQDGRIIEPFQKRFS